MLPRERVMTALRLGQPDQVPWVENGFDVALQGNQTERAIHLMRMCDALIPFLTSGLAIWVIASYSVTEEKAHEVRMQLEARRGKH